MSIKILNLRLKFIILYDKNVIRKQSNDGDRATIAKIKMIAKNLKLR